MISSWHRINQPELSVWDKPDKQMFFISFFSFSDQTLSRYHSLFFTSSTNWHIYKSKSSNGPVSFINEPSSLGFTRLVSVSCTFVAFQSWWCRTWKCYYLHCCPIECYGYRHLEIFLKSIFRTESCEKRQGRGLEM